jgi:hypothetical protein
MRVNYIYIYINSVSIHPLTGKYVGNASLVSPIARSVSLESSLYSTQVRSVNAINITAIAITAITICFLTEIAMIMLVLLPQSLVNTNKRKEKKYHFPLFRQLYILWKTNHHGRVNALAFFSFYSPRFQDPHPIPIKMHPVVQFELRVLSFMQPVL